jgi:hypothetical protein
MDVNLNFWDCHHDFDIGGVIKLMCGERMQKWYEWLKAWNILPRNKASEPEAASQLYTMLESPADLLARKCRKDCEKTI